MDKVLGDKIPEFNRKDDGRRSAACPARRPLGIGGIRTQARDPGHRARRGRHHRRRGDCCCASSTCRNISCRSRARSSWRCSPNGPTSGRICLIDALRTARRLRDRRLDRLRDGGGHHAVSLRREGRHALHSAAGDDADAGAGAAADPALRLRQRAAHHRGGAGVAARW